MNQSACIRFFYSSLCWYFVNRQPNTVHSLRGTYVAAYIQVIRLCECRRNWKMGREEEGGCQDPSAGKRAGDKNTSKDKHSHDYERKHKRPRDPSEERKRSQKKAKKSDKDHSSKHRRREKIDSADPEKQKTDFVSNEKKRRDETDSTDLNHKNAKHHTDSTVLKHKIKEKSDLEPVNHKRKEAIDDRRQEGELRNNNRDESKSLDEKSIKREDVQSKVSNKHSDEKSKRKEDAQSKDSDDKHMDEKNRKKEDVQFKESYKHSDEKNRKRESDEKSTTAKEDTQNKHLDEKTRKREDGQSNKYSDEKSRKRDDAPVGKSRKKEAESKGADRHDRWQGGDRSHHRDEKHKSSSRSSALNQRKKEDNTKAKAKERSASPHHRGRPDREKDGKSGLGGYSPRRRRSEAAIKTPSPPPRSPDRRKSRAWDLIPPGVDNNMVAAMAVAQQQAAAVNALTVAVLSAAQGQIQLSTPSAMPNLVSSIIQHINPAASTVTLTQATRPLRRLYIGNIPSTVSDVELQEFMNSAMLSAKANHLPGTKPCIGCSVNVEKGYAFAEFLTSEDAAAAIAFDGVTLQGTTLKIRRPKDFIPPANGGGEGALPATRMVSDIVIDSPNKVFVGGISSLLTSDKVKEIVTSFGQLKAYHWEVDTRKQFREAYAFLEYLDPSVTIKACAGLSGMKLGDRILTVVQATPTVKTENSIRRRPFYGVPEHARALLKSPTCILQLENMITKMELLSTSEQDVADLEEDVRLECSRFGIIKSLHLIRSAVLPQAVAEPLSTVPEAIEVTAAESNRSKSEASADVNDTLLRTAGEKLYSRSKVGEVTGESARPIVAGTVLVEFSREESSCNAAHALNGRTYGDHIVIASYCPVSLYRNICKSMMEHQK